MFLDEPLTEEEFDIQWSVIDEAQPLFLALMAWLLENPDHTRTER